MLVRVNRNIYAIPHKGVSAHLHHRGVEFCHVFLRKREGDPFVRHMLPRFYAYTPHHV